MDTARDVAKCVWREAVTDRTMIVAAGLAFFALFGLLPALAVVAAAYGLVVDRAAMERQLEALAPVLPEDATELLGEFLTTVSEGFAGGPTLFVNLAIVLWTVQRAASGVITALNVVYDHDETRGRVKREVVALAIAFGVLAFLFVSLFLIAIMPLLGLGNGWWARIVLIGRWPFLAVLFMVGLGLLYAYAPARERAEWRWVSWGAAVATVLWLAASALFSLYMAWIGGWDVYYGSVTALVILMAWMFISAFLVMAGAEINAQLAARFADEPRDHVKTVLDRRERREDR